MPFQQAWGGLLFITLVQGYLRDTCLAAQDEYKQLLDYFKVKYKE